MKVRLGFVSNSSSSSFIGVGWDISDIDWNVFIDEYRKINGDQYIIKALDHFLEPDQIKLLLNNESDKNYVDIMSEEDIYLPDFIETLMAQSNSSYVLENSEWFNYIVQHLPEEGNAKNFLSKCQQIIDNVENDNNEFVNVIKKMTGREAEICSECWQDC